MAMNLLHRRRCSSAGWAELVRDQMLPWTLHGVELGERTLEIGPGYGATLRTLLDRAAAVTAVEVDKPMAERLQRLYGDRARVIHGDGTATGLPDTSFNSVVCFTMLHHVPTDRLQDQLFAEAFRVLTPGGVFVGTDRLPSLAFRLILSAMCTTPSARGICVSGSAGWVSATFVSTWRAPDSAGALPRLRSRHAPIRLARRLFREHPGESTRRGCDRSCAGRPR